MEKLKNFQLIGKKVKTELGEVKTICDITETLAFVKEEPNMSYPISKLFYGNKPLYAYMNEMNYTDTLDVPYQKDVIAEIETSIKVPYVNCIFSSISDKSNYTVEISFSFDWPNNILEDSIFAKFMVDKNEIILIDKHYTLPNCDKGTVSNTADVINFINSYITSLIDCD